jgi:hypothetical protein
MHSRRRLWRFKVCGAQTSVTAGRVMHKRRTAPPVVLGRPTWSAPTIRASRRRSSIASSASAPRRRCVDAAAQAARGDGRSRTRTVKREAAVDEFFLGGARRASQAAVRGKKTLCGVAVKVRGPARTACASPSSTTPRAGRTDPWSRP